MAPPRVLSLAFLFLVTPGIRAGEPWREKSYKHWDKREVRKILSDSPWARMIGIPAAWTRPGHEGIEVGVSARVGRVSDPEYEGELPAEQIAMFTVRWASSRTIRAALAREAILARRMHPRQAETILAKQPEEYEIVLVADLLVRFPQTSEAQLRQNTFLRPTGTARDIRPGHVEIRRNTGGRVTEVSFYFPKHTESGEPLIATDERRVEFHCSLGGTSLRADFQPSKMRDRAGPDL